ncbi:MAG: DUF4313 domain-containing protein [Coprococcus sp.]
MSKKMNYESKWGDVNVELSMSQYTDNGNIYLELVNTEGEYPEPYGNITVNLGGVPKYCGYVDTNNMPEMEKFLEENDLGDFTGITLKSGFCEYPLYVFNVDKLRELCPKQMAEYEKTLNVTKIKNMKRAGEINVSRNK